MKRSVRKSTESSGVVVNIAIPTITSSVTEKCIWYAIKLTAESVKYSDIL
jgi:hypothetical protein